MDTVPASPKRYHVKDELIRRGLRLPQLRLLVALSDTGQVSAAATQVAMTQPAASRLLAELERTVGAPLYNRNARGVTLTLAGFARPAVGAGTPRSPRWPAESAAPSASAASPDPRSSWSFRPSGNFA